AASPASAGNVLPGSIIVSTPPGLIAAPGVSGSAAPAAVAAPGRSAFAFSGPAGASAWALALPQSVPRLPTATGHSPPGDADLRDLVFLDYPPAGSARTL